MFRLWRNIVLISILLVLGFTGNALAEPITIGAVGPLSGPAANSGIAMKQAFEYVVEKTNQNGGLEVGGEKREVKLIIEDDQMRPEMGVSAAQKLLTRDQVDILIGDMFNSSVTLAIMGLAKSFNNTFFMSGQPVSGAISDKIKNNPDDYRNFWKANFDSQAYGKTVFQTIKTALASGKAKAPNKTIAFITEDGDYGKSNIEYTRKQFVDHGWKVVLSQTVPLGEAEFYPQITKMRGASPDVLVSVFTSANSGAALVQQLIEKDVKPLHMAIYYPARPEFQTAVGDTANGLLWTPLFFDPAHNDQHRAFAEKFKKTTGVDATFDHAAGVCQMGMLLDNIKNAGSVKIDPLVQAFKNTDYHCMIGRWVFKSDTHSPKTGPDYYPVPGAQIQNGESYVIWPESTASSEYKAP